MKPNFAITHERREDGFTLLTVDTTKATWQGYKWRELGTPGKAKFETLLMLMSLPQRIKIRYV